MTIEGKKMTRKVPKLGVFLALALILSYVESLIPFYFGIPGMKLGLTNVIIVLILYLDDWKDAALISFTRVLIAGFMFGNVYSIIYSLGGALLSFLIMLILKKTMNLHIITISICGGIFHNIGQILVAVWAMDNIYIAGYIPALYIAGIITGFLIGLLAYELYPRLIKVFNR